VSARWRPLSTEGENYRSNVERMIVDRIERLEMVALDSERVRAEVKT
jgi:hypothetical protein